jgi:hypothetical protein
MALAPQKYFKNFMKWFWRSWPRWNNFSWVFDHAKTISAGFLTPPKTILAGSLTTLKLFQRGSFTQLKFICPGWFFTTFEATILYRRNRSHMRIGLAS